MRFSLFWERRSETKTKSPSSKEGALADLFCVPSRARIERESRVRTQVFFCASLLSPSRRRFFLTHFFLFFSPRKKKKKKKADDDVPPKEEEEEEEEEEEVCRRHTHTHTHKKKVSETGAFIHFATWPFDTVRGVVLTKPRFELGISGSLRTLDIYLKCQHVSTCQHTLNPKM